MSQKVTQKLVNQKCELLKSQNEEITVNKVRKLIGGNISIIDLVEKVTLYKQDKKNALASAESEEQPLQEKPCDQLLDIIQTTLKEYSIEENQVAFSLRSNLKKYIDQQVSEKSKKLKQKQVEVSNKNDSLEISNLTLNRRYNELLEKYNELKEDLHNIKQDFNNRAIKQLKKENEVSSLLNIEDFNTFQDQLRKYKEEPMVAVYDNTKNVIMIKFPHTHALTAECRRGSSAFLQAKTKFDFDNKVWQLTDYNMKTINYLRSKRFVFSRELETIVYISTNKRNNVS